MLTQPTGRAESSRIHPRGGGVGRRLRPAAAPTAACGWPQAIRAGLYLAFAEILAKQVQNRYPDIAVDVLSTEGSVENLARLAFGDVDMGLALADVAERDRATGPVGNRA